MRFLELFSGTHRMSDAFRSRGATVLSVDLNEDCDLKKDVSLLSYDDICSRLGGEPDVIWASPPCTGFSVAAGRLHWPDYKPDSVAQEGCALFGHTFRICMMFRFAKYFIENPVGFQSNLPILALLPRKKISYCSYGEPYQKPTWVWTNEERWNPKPCCKRGSSCHPATPRGAHKGINGMKDAKVRAALPFKLCEEIAGLYFEKGKQIALFGDSSEDV